MARMARIVVPDIPYHVTQRGNRRQDVFFRDEDYEHYRLTLSEQCEKWRVEVWAYCLMPNHVHLIVVPRDADGLARAIGDAHRSYTRHVHFREGWRVYLWQGRFASFAMSERHLLAAARYVELNPVRAVLCESAREWPWSSAGPHLNGVDDELVRVRPLLDLVSDWEGLLASGNNADDLESLRKHSRSGRPLGDDAFLRRLELATGRTLRRRRPGPPPAR